MAKANLTTGSPIVGLDIGTSAVRVVMAVPNDEGPIEIIGFGEVESKGLRKGVISRPDDAVESIKRAVEAAEHMAGMAIGNVYVGLAGSHIKGENNQGRIAVTGRHREIGRDDIRRVIETACAISLPAGREVADVIPQEYTVDDQDGIDDPLGMLGSRLSVSVHIVTSPVAAKQNIITSVNRAGLHVADVYLSHLAAAEAVLSDDDREYGSAVVNIGAETTSLAIYQRGAVWHTAVFPIGGSHFTNDIAVGLQTQIPEAERIKRNGACAAHQLLTPEMAAELIEVPSIGGRPPRVVSRQILCDILEPRAEEVLSYVQQEIRQAGFDRQLSSGVVLTGGGALLSGLIEVAEQVFSAPTRIGVPEGYAGLGRDLAKPSFAAAVGLAAYGIRCDVGTAGSDRQVKSPEPERDSIKDRLKLFFGIDK
ncbi:MAG: cell division protein FtsA [Acidobacteriota bacterium]|jgi:cell division protein FtsA